MTESDEVTRVAGNQLLADGNGQALLEKCQHFIQVT